MQIYHKLNWDQKYNCSTSLPRNLTYTTFCIHRTGFSCDYVQKMLQMLQNKKLSMQWTWMDLAGMSIWVNATKKTSFDTYAVASKCFMDLITAAIMPFTVVQLPYINWESALFSSSLAQGNGSAILLWTDLINHDPF